jgi:hypothetical protein
VYIVPLGGGGGEEVFMVCIGLYIVINFTGNAILKGLI